jgi:hypothetical protein
MFSSFFGKNNKKSNISGVRLEPDVTEQYRSVVAPQALEVREDYLAFPQTVLLPITARGNGVPGMVENLGAV